MLRVPVGLIVVAALFYLAASEEPVSDENVTILTPDPQVNREIAGKPISAIDLIRYEEDMEAKTLTIVPQLPPHWTWIAAKNLSFDGKPLLFFFRNGLLFTNRGEVEYCGFRLRRYENLITDKISADTFVIAMQKKDETVVFAATEEPKDVHLVIDKSVFGDEKVFDFHLGANESELIRIYPKGAPSLP